MKLCNLAQQTHNEKNITTSKQLYIKYIDIFFK